jgi:hypothetical protein
LRIQIANFLERNRALAILMLFVLQFINGAISTHSIFDRREMKKTAEMSRQMLDARARIQITLINTGNRRGAFTEDEIKILSENWDKAEYSLITPDPFK